MFPGTFISASVSEIKGNVYQIFKFKFIFIKLWLMIIMVNIRSREKLVLF